MIFIIKSPRLIKSVRFRRVRVRAVVRRKNFSLSRQNRLS